MPKPKKPEFTWAFDDGVLTIHHDGKTVVLGRYAAHEWAAAAAAKYIAQQKAKP